MTIDGKSNSGKLAMKSNIRRKCLFYSVDILPEADETFEKQTMNFKRKQCNVMGDFSYPGICGGKNSTKYGPSKIFLVYVDSFLSPPPKKKLEGKKLED